MASSAVLKIGPCGGAGGSAVDITREPKLLQSITIRSGAVIDSIGFSFLDNDGNSRYAGPWGGTGGQAQVIQLAANEYVIEISGTFDKFDTNQDTVIISLKIVTNLNTYGPYGNSATGVPYSLPAQPGNAIVGFFARGGAFIDAIGVYVRRI